MFVSTMGRLHRYIDRGHAPKRGWIGDRFVRDATGCWNRRASARRIIIRNANIFHITNLRYMYYNHEHPTPNHRAWPCLRHRNPPTRWRRGCRNVVPNSNVRLLFGKLLIGKKIEQTTDQLQHAVWWNLEEICHAFLNLLLESGS